MPRSEQPTQQYVHVSRSSGETWARPGTHEAQLTDRHLVQVMSRSWPSEHMAHHCRQIRYVSKVSRKNIRRLQVIHHHLAFHRCPLCQDPWAVGKQVGRREGERLQTKRLVTGMEIGKEGGGLELALGESVWRTLQWFSGRCSSVCSSCWGVLGES